MEDDDDDDGQRDRRMQLRWQQKRRRLVSFFFGDEFLLEGETNEKFEGGAHFLEANPFFFCSLLFEILFFAFLSLSLSLSNGKCVNNAGMIGQRVLLPNGDDGDGEWDEW